jgi:hypothetical protein
MNIMMLRSLLRHLSYAPPCRHSSIPPPLTSSPAMPVQVPVCMYVETPPSETKWGLCWLRCFTFSELSNSRVSNWHFRLDHRRSQIGGAADGQRRAGWRWLSARVKAPTLRGCSMPCACRAIAFSRRWRRCSTVCQADGAGEGKQRGGRRTLLADHGDGDGGQ